MALLSEQIPEHVDLGPLEFDHILKYIFLFFNSEIRLLLKLNLINSFVLPLEASLTNINSLNFHLAFDCILEMYLRITKVTCLYFYLLLYFAKRTDSTNMFVSRSVPPFF